MNIFSTAERSVQRYSFNKKELNELDKKSDAVIAKESYDEIKKEDELNTINNEFKQKVKREIVNERAEKVILSSLTDGKINSTLNRIMTECKTNVLKEIIFETFNDALWIDDDFITENSNKLYNVVNRYVDDNGGYNVLTEAISANPNSRLLQKIDEVCKSTANKVSKRKLSEIKTSVDADVADASMNDEERKDLDYNKGNLNTEEISKLVKDKVLTVIQDEKNRSEKDTKIIERIENELKNDKNVTDEKSLDEALSNIVINNSPFEEATLFNSLLRNSYEELLHENVAISSDVKHNYDNKRDFSDEYDPNATIDDIDDEHLEDDELYDEFNDINDDLLLKENSHTIDMDLVFCEAITKYTLMETLYTMKLENYTHENIRNLTQKIVNPIMENKSKTEEPNEYVEARKHFFKIFNNFKDLKDVDSAKEKLSKHVNEACENGDDKTKHAYEVCIKMGISQLEDCCEKNPHLADKYKEIIKWCQNELLGDDE